MTFSPEEYYSFFTWSGSKVIEYAKAGDLFTLMGFLADEQEIKEDLVDAWDQVPRLGKPKDWLGRLVQFLGQVQDPLKATRLKMRAMRDTYK